ncbi:MAG: hypothetical protein KAR40_09560 [Candidatus Sabulitectum sp.]|nr:hypothetical protein [Candidatus Sabulitectum sp.]
MDKKTCDNCGDEAYIDGPAGYPYCKPCITEWLSLTFPTLHTIKPLEWEERTDLVECGDLEYFTAKTSVNEYIVLKKESDSSKIRRQVFGGEDMCFTYWWYVWPGGHGFKQQYSCTSIAHGQELAEAHYREQIGKCLEVYNEN